MLAASKNKNDQMTLKEIFENQEFIKYRHKELNVSDKEYFLEKLQNGRGIYDVLPFIAAAKELPEELLEPIVREILEYKDLSLPKRYIENILRVFTPEKVQEAILKIMVDEKNFKIKCKAAGILYCIGSRFLIGSLLKNGEIEWKSRGGYFWNGERYERKAVEGNIDSFVKKREKFYHRRLEVLIREFKKTDNIIYKYFLRRYLPNKIQEYPLNIQKETKEIIKEITSIQFPQGAKALTDLVQGKEDLEFLLFEELNWQKK